MTRFTARWIASFLVMLVMGTGACASWKRLEVPPAEYLTKEPESMVRVWPQRATKGIPVRRARLSGDTLVGLRWEGRASVDERGRPTGAAVAFPLDSIARTEKHEISAWRTALLTAGIVAFLVAQPWLALLLHPDAFY